MKKLSPDNHERYQRFKENPTTEVTMHQKYPQISCVHACKMTTSYQYFNDYIANIFKLVLKRANHNGISYLFIIHKVQQQKLSKAAD